jgi:hypothetical protein
LCVGHRPFGRSGWMKLNHPPSNKGEDQSRETRGALGCLVGSTGQACFWLRASATRQSSFLALEEKLDCFASLAMTSRVTRGGQRVRWRRGLDSNQDVAACTPPG